MASECLGVQGFRGLGCRVWGFRVLCFGLDGGEEGGGGGGGLGFGWSGRVWSLGWNDCFGLWGTYTHTKCVCVCVTYRLTGL